MSKIKLANPLVTVNKINRTLPCQQNCVNKINRIQSEQDKISEPFGHCQQNEQDKISELIEYKVNPSLAAKL